jgi:hypothetical protein
LNHPKNPAPIPRVTDYASAFESGVPIVLRHTRLDSRRAELSPLSTMAYAQTWHSAGRFRPEHKAIRRINTNLQKFPS